MERRLLLSSVLGDFNGDGFDDLAVGVPHEDIGSVANAGAVNVLYGSAAGLTSTGNQIWYQGNGIADSAEAGDHFGEAIAVADFNGDGFDDLAVGVPFEDVGSIKDAGAVHVLFGSASGLTSSGNRLWHQNSGTVAGSAETGDRFGQALAAGKFNGDSYADLAIGVPLEDIGSKVDAGAVNILYGSSGGLTDSGNRQWHQDSTDILDQSASGDRFGWSLASALFDSDSYADLAIGVPLDAYGVDSNGVGAGAVSILYGTHSGLSASNNQRLTQGALGIADPPEPQDRFGFSLAAGDFNGDGRADLAVGVPFENVASIWDAGMVHVVYGSSAGLGTSTMTYHQNSGDVEDDAEHRDHFGYSLAAGDFDNDGRDDLAIAVPNEMVGSAREAGAVAVVYGQSPPFFSVRDELWHQDTPGISEISQERDHFGLGLATGDFNNDGRADLAVAAPDDSVYPHVNAGGVNVIYGAMGGLTASGDQFWAQDSGGVSGGSETGDRFGAFGGATPLSEFNIELNFPDYSLTAKQRELFYEAVRRWSEVIMGDVPDYTYPSGIVIDDLLIDAYGVPGTDGAGNAKVTVKRPGSHIPARATVNLDTDELASKSEENVLMVILHEMGHALGIGAIWNDQGLISGSGTSNPRFTGKQATLQYNAIFVNSETSVPVSTGGNHWRECVFDKELMSPVAATGFLPLSRITAASLWDLGYFVDLDGADLFTPPSPSCT